MAIIQLPAGVRPRAVEWRFEETKVWQVSEFTGRTRVARFGPSGRWLLDLDFPPLSETQARALRAVLAQLSSPTNGLLYFAGTAQHGGPNMTLGASLPAGSTTATLSHSSASTQLLAAGQMIMFQVGGPVQLVTLTQPVVTDASGNAVVTWAQPLRSTAGAGPVETRSPYSVFRARQPLAWSASPGPLTQVQLSLEEAFEVL